MGPVTDQDGTVSVRVKDKTERIVADGLEIDPANSSYITTSHDYTYSDNGKVETQRLPNYYNPPEASQPEEWLVTSNYDLLERLTDLTTPQIHHSHSDISTIKRGKCGLLRMLKGQQMDMFYIPNTILWVGWLKMGFTISLGMKKHYKTTPITSRHSQLPTILG